MPGKTRRDEQRLQLRAAVVSCAAVAFASLVNDAWCDPAEVIVEALPRHCPLPTSSDPHLASFPQASLNSAGSYCRRHCLCVNVGACNAATEGGHNGFASYGTQRAATGGDKGAA